MIHIHWPQGIMLALYFTSMLMEANRHGKERKVTGNIWTTMISCCLSLGLLYWGGFFK